MLDILRRSAASWVAKILFAILVISFAIWGIGDIFRRGGHEVTVAHVGDQAISGRALVTDFQRYVEQMQPSFGGHLDAQKARELGFVNVVLQRMLGRALFDQAAHNLGLRVSDQTVAARIKSDPAFKGPGGGFDEITFRQALLRAGYSEQAFTELLRQDLARDELTRSVRDTAWAPEGMVDLLYRYRMERRVAETVEVPDDSITDVPEPDEATLVAFHKAHEKDFMAPEYRRVTVVTLGPQDLAKEIDVKEEDIRQAYDENKARFTKLERRKIEQILLPDEEAAKKAEALLAEGKDFAAVAKDVSGKDPIDLGWVTKPELPADLRDPAFQAAENTPTAPIKTGLGWHILKVTTIEPGEVKSYEDAREELRKSIALEKARDGLYALSNQLQDELAGGARLEDAASKLGLKVTTYDAIDSRGNDASGAKIKDLPGEPFLTTAFKTAQGQTSDLIDAGDAGYFILRVDKITPEAVRPLDKIRGVVVALWKAEQRKKQAQARANDIAAAVKGGKSLADAAAPFKLDVKTTEPFLRSGSESLPEAVVTEIFGLQPGGVATGATDTGYIAARLKDVIPAHPAKDKAGVTALTGDLRTAMGNDLLIEYGGALEGRYKVRVDREAIDTLFLNQ
jgi:peptidyl-prolyl cis-trans isomerase D